MVGTFSPPTLQLQLSKWLTRFVFCVGISSLCRMRHTSDLQVQESVCTNCAANVFPFNDISDDVSFRKFSNSVLAMVDIMYLDKI